MLPAIGWSPGGSSQLHFVHVIQFHGLPTVPLFTVGGATWEACRGNLEVREPSKHLLRDPRKPLRDPRKPLRDPRKPLRDPRKPLRDPGKPLRDQRKSLRDPSKPLRDPYILIFIISDSKLEDPSFFYFNTCAVHSLLFLYQPIWQVNEG